MVAKHHDGSSTLSAPASRRRTGRTASQAGAPRRSTPATEYGNVDVLSDVLRTARLTGALFFPMEVSSPWVDEVPAATEFASVVLPGAEHVVSYHIVRRG